MASGDLIYEVTEEAVEVTAAEAATAADWFIARGAWSGARGDLVAGRVYRGGDGKFYAACRGRKTIAPGNVPESGAAYNVVGKEP